MLTAMSSRNAVRLRPATQIRLVVIAAAVALLELACRTGVIRRFTMIPPSEMLTSLVDLFETTAIVSDILETMTAIFIALLSALVVGFLLGALLYASPRGRRIVDPLLATYYSVPVFVFYPLFIVLFGLNSIPKTVIGFLYALVAMVINTLGGLDRVPSVFWKTAKAYGLNKVVTATRIILPCASPHLFTGAKLAVVYSFTGVIGSEFILSSGGLGYRISFSYNNFQSDVMYALVLFVLIIVICINMGLYAWERRLAERRGGR